MLVILVFLRPQLRECHLGGVSGTPGRAWGCVCHGQHGEAAAVWPAGICAVGRLLGGIWPGGRGGPLGFPASVPVSHRGPCVCASHRDPRCLRPTGDREYLHPTEDHVCLHPTGDHTCLHPTGDHVCLHPMGKHTCVHPSGILGHACHVVPPLCPHARAASPGKLLQVMCVLVRGTCLLSANRDAISRGCTVCVHTCRKQSTRRQVCL